MTTYVRESADNLRLALASLAAQTMPAAEVVLVLDGPVGSDQEAVITEAQAGLPLKVIRLPRNVGLALALSEGLNACTQPWCARMDSDDISEPQRFERQWAVLQARPELDLIGTWTAEFENDPACVTGMKTGPEDHDAIVRILYWRNVVHHPTVLMRISKVSEAGGYSAEFPLLEDYDLFLRMVALGARLTIVPLPLLRFRISEAQRRRRGGFRYLAVEARFRWRTVVSGISPPWIAALAFLATMPFRLAPPTLKSWAYRMVRSAPARSVGH